MSALPDDLTQETYEKAVVYAKLASKAYDADDWITAGLSLRLFSGLDDVLNQSFETPSYNRLRGGGNWIDWWLGKDQGIDYVMFENKESLDVVVAFRGTEPLSLEDWAEDAKQALGTSGQYKAAVELATNIKSRIEEENKRDGTGKELSFTGHSLGGGLATAAALATGCKAIAFDAAGISNKTMNDKALGLLPENESQVSNFNVKGCFVSDWNGKMDKTTIGTIEKLGIVCQQYGSVFWLESISDRTTFLPKKIWSKFNLKGNAAPDKVEALFETFMAHAWHLFTYQLEHKKFEPITNTGSLQEDDASGPPRKRAKTALVTPEKGASS
jgi:Lipase (class 3)